MNKLTIGIGLAAFTAVAVVVSGLTETIEATKGPVVSDFGPVYDVPGPDFETPLDRNYRVVFDVSKAPQEPGRINPSIETAARFLNMHARAGVSQQKLHVAIVLHGGAGKYALQNASYKSRFGDDNPNLALIRDLRSASVRVILCGQTAASRGFERSELAEPVELALSAMTALVTLQQDGYQLIAF